MRTLLFAFAGLTLAASTGSAASGLAVPPGFGLATIAEVPAARELAVAPNGDLFVGTSSNRVYVIHDPDSASPRVARVFVTIDDAPVAGVAFGEGALYVGGQFHVWKVPYESGDQNARGDPVSIASVRTSGVARDHFTTTVAVDGGTLYASVGSSCDACDPDLDPTRATIQEMGLDGTGMHPKAVQIRNAIALAVNPDTHALWAGVAGQDALPHGRPFEIFDPVSLHPGVVEYGWPYCYDDHRDATRGHDCSKQTLPRVVFPAYDTPIGAIVYPLHAGGPHAFPERYRGGAFVTLHGSWHVPLVPPRVAFVPLRDDQPSRHVDWSNPDTQWSEFLGGFQADDGQRIGRPTGVAVGKSGDLFVADDLAGRVYRIRWH